MGILIHWPGEFLYFAWHRP